MPWSVLIEGGYMNNSLPTGTLEEAVVSSIRVWDSLAKTGMCKSELAVQAPQLNKLHWRCPACEYAKRVEVTQNKCDSCPIWDTSYRCTRDTGLPIAPYVKWENALDDSVLECDLNDVDITEYLADAAKGVLAEMKHLVLERYHNGQELIDAALNNPIEIYEVE
jgi:hypothetical protein